MLASMKYVVALIAGLVLGACSNSPIHPAPQGQADRQLVASKVATLALGIAVAGEGRGPFDNYLACPRRGVINYHNTPAGRSATFSGCDAGDGVVIDGTAVVKWPNPQDPTKSFTSLDVEGNLTAQFDGPAAAELVALSVTGLLNSADGFDEVTISSFSVANANVTAYGETRPLDARATPANVFTPALTIDAIPNPGGGLDALSDADVRRLVLQELMVLARILLNENLESGRGEHTHATSCGTLHAAPDGQFVRTDAVYNACQFGPGTIVSGAFTARWSSLTQSDMRMVITGWPTFGGGVPKITLDRVEWALSGVTAADSPYQLTFSGRLVKGTAERVFSFTVLADN